MSTTYELLAQGGTSRYLQEASGATIKISAGNGVSLVQPPQVAAIPTSAIHRAFLPPNRSADSGLVNTPAIAELANLLRRFSRVTTGQHKDLVWATPPGPRQSHVMPRIRSGLAGSRAVQRVAEAMLV